MKEAEILEKVKAFADEAHADQKRKYTPERYIVHPVRVMNICKEYKSDLPVLVAALLHDVLEDTPVTKDDIQSFLTSLLRKEQAEAAVKLVVELTDVYVKQAYPDWNRRKRKRMEADRITKTSAAAQTVKYADIIDNCTEIVEHDPDFANVFIRECKNLLKRMPDGNVELFQRAMETVDTCLERLSKKSK